MGVQTGLSEMGFLYSLKLYEEELGATWKLWLKKSLKPQALVLQLPLVQPHALCLYLELAKGQVI